MRLLLPPESISLRQMRQRKVEFISVSATLYCILLYLVKNLRLPILFFVFYSEQYVKFVFNALSTLNIRSFNRRVFYIFYRSRR